MKRPDSARKLPRVLAGLVLASCASSTPEPQKPSAAMSSIPRALTSNSGLTAQQLQTGECGLFLWTKGLPNTLIFFSKAGTNSALIKMDDKDESLELVEAEGRIFGQFMTQQTYKTPNQVTVTLTFDAGKILEDGQRLKNGRLTLISAEGWETIMPVLGVRACQPG